MKKIERAIISLTDKSGVTDFANSISKFGVQILSTGGTAKVLREAGISVTEISEYTGFPEMLDGRVKTLHPKVHGGLLGQRDNPEHVNMMNEHGIANIDLLVVNLYQFEKTVAKAGVTLEEAIENIDIGGPAMLRSSAKNFKDVTVIVDPSDYALVLKEMAEPSAMATELRMAFLKPQLDRLLKAVGQFLGEGADELKVRVCAVSVHSQYVLMNIERHKGKPLLGKLEIDAERLEAIIAQLQTFALAGMRAIREGAGDE